MRLLQVCNVGRIVGGTAACAWSIARALPEVEHHVAFPASITEETQAAFAGARLHRAERITDRFIRELGCDGVILHNVPASRMERITSAWTLQYVHSKGTRAPADCTRYCSRWLADQCLGQRATDDHVLYQGVPRPAGAIRPADSNRLIVGRICTPTHAKWPASLVDFYASLTSRQPGIDWEFVGCPTELHDPLRKACDGRAAFHPASWTARSHLRRWNAVLYHHPTLTESLGRTAAEAMRAGCIPIFDARGGFLEQINVETGWLCSTPADFSQALEHLKDPSLRNRVASRARDRADQIFSLSAFRQRLLDLWSSM